MQKLIPPILKIIGVVLVLIGIVAAYYGPLEIFVFYLFSEGGQFHYEGFGVGSFWFAVLVVHNIGYYIIVALCIPVGIGYIKLRRWVLTITILYLWLWLGAGILLVSDFMLLIPTILNLDISQDILYPRLVIVGISLLVALIIFPVLALLFYKSEKVKLVFEEDINDEYWIERYPNSILAILLLFVIMIIVMHIAIFFQSVFPMFGQIMLGRQSVYIIALCILIMGILIYGIAQLKTWAWWGSIVFISLLTISSIMTFSRFSLYDIILKMGLPAYEMELLNKMTVIHDIHLTVSIAYPLIAVLGLTIYSKRYYGQGEKVDKSNTS